MWVAGFRPAAEEKLCPQRTSHRGPQLLLIQTLHGTSLQQPLGSQPLSAEERQNVYLYLF